MRTSALVRVILRQDLREELVGAHADGSIVRTRVNTTWLGKIMAQVARCSFVYHVRLLRNPFLVEAGHHRKFLQIDVAVRAAFDTRSAANAPIFNDDFQRSFAADGADGTAHHAQRIAAVPAGGCDQEAVEAQAVADQAGHSIVSVGTSLHALITTRAAIQIQHQQALRLHQPLCEELINGDGADLPEALMVFLQPKFGGFAYACVNLGEFPQHLVEVFPRYAHHLYVVERRASRGANAAAEEPYFAEVPALG